VILVTSDWHEVEAELDRLSIMPTPKMVAALEWLTDTGFAATQAAAHIETGSLKSSGKVDYTTSRVKSQWSGEISYGGPSAGVNDPVDYAIYEAARGTTWAGPSSAKGDHNFMHPMDVIEKTYPDVIAEELA
jgi:hypothetical protein